MSRMLLTVTANQGPRKHLTLYHNYYLFKTLLNKVVGRSVYSVSDRESVPKISERSERTNKNERVWAENYFL